MRSTVAVALCIGAFVADRPSAALAISPNISIDACDGGLAVSMWPAMAVRTVHGSIFGELSGESLFGGYCPGYYAERPHFCLHVSAPGGPYTLEVTDAEGADTTLALVGPSLPQPFCDDDGAPEMRSRIVSWLEPGEYTVHVGSFSSGVRARFSLTVEPGERW